MWYWYMKQNAEAIAIAIASRMEFKFIQKCNDILYVWWMVASFAHLIIWWRWEHVYIVHDPEDLVILSEWSWTGEEIYKEIWSLVVLRPPDGSNFFIIRPFGILVISLCTLRSGFVDLVLNRKLIKFSTRFFKIPAIWSLEQSKKGVGH